VIQYYRMIKKSLAMRGIGQTIVYAAKWPQVIYDEHRSLRERNATQSRFDSRHGTDTGGIIPLSSFSIDNPNWIHGVRYAPTSPQGFADSLSLLNLSSDSYKDLTFIDIGAGKGATLLYAADLGFKQVIGIEFVEELHKIAEKNLSVYPSAQNIGKSVCADASLYEMPDSPLVAFFNYPFSSQQLMDKVISNISKSRKGPKYLVTLNYPYDPAKLPSSNLRLINVVSRSERSNYAFEVL
jgi:SAM-dependent methyltransferase